jgi:uncharacterized protein YqjF (DUF2071 family)
MVHRWECLTFLHWPYDLDLVQRLLPDGLTVEPYNGAAWVGLVPFRMTVRAPGTPPVPWASTFAETNVRTYVRGPDGRTGVWFLSLDASRLGAVVAARTTFRLPYYWSRMRAGRRGDTARYVSTRRWPGPRGARNEVEVTVGAPVAAPTAFENYLTARFSLYDPGLRRAQAHHEPWPLRRATVRRLDPGLLTAAGLPAPTDEPTTHWSDGVEVRIGPPRRSRQGATSSRR